MPLPMLNADSSPTSKSDQVMRPHVWLLDLSTTRGGRRAVVAVGVVVLALGVWYAAQTYFRYDEWAFWTFRRDLLNAGGEKNLIRFFFSAQGGSPYGGAMPAGLMALWLPLDWIFGMHVYWPYALPTMVLHVLAGVLMFELLARWLRPNVALATSGLFLIMGNAASVITYGWLVNFVAPLAAIFIVLLAIVRLEHRRERAMVSVTLGATLAAISFSNVGLVAATVVAVAYALRRRLALAGVHLGAVIAVFAIWRAFYEPPGVPVRLGESGRYLEFAWNGLTTAGGDLVGLAWTPVGVLVLIAAAAGGAWSWWERDPASIVNIPTLVGAGVFYGMVAVRGVDLPTTSFSFDQDRYLYIATALLLPSIAWLVNRAISIRAWVAWPALLLLVWAVSLNLGHSREAVDDQVALGISNRITIETAASLVGHLEPLDDGILVADHSARFTVEQFKILYEQGKVPCVADFGLAVTFTQDQRTFSPEHWMLAPTPDQVSCP